MIDTDVGLDDFRAVAVLLPQRALQAVVVTEGSAGVPRGSTAMAMFLASAPSSAPIIPGLAAAHPPAYDWLPEVRAGAERLNGFLAQAVPFASPAQNITAMQNTENDSDVARSGSLSASAMGYLVRGETRASARDSVRRRAISS